MKLIDGQLKRAATHSCTLAVASALALTACEGQIDTGDPSVETNTVAIFTPASGPVPREGECDIDDPFIDSVRHTIHHAQNLAPGTLKKTVISEPDDIRSLVSNRRAAHRIG